MNSISALSDGELLNKTENLASEERRVTALLIEHLREVNRRRLFSDLGCSSLHRYCHKILKMSEGAAQRRIDALRLTESHPEVKEKIENGDLSLSMASRLQTFFRQEEKLTEVSEEKKKEMIESVQGLSTFEAERALLRKSIDPVRHSPEKVRVVSETALQVQFTATREQMALFEEVRSLMAHTDSHLSWSELFEKMAQIAKQKLDPSERKCRTVYPQRRSTQTPRRESRVASVALKREVLKRDQGKCVQCSSTFALEMDHIQPWMLGGETKLENLRTLCRNCNQRESIRAFGVKKVAKEISRAG